MPSVTARQRIAIVGLLVLLAVVVGLAPAASAAPATKDTYRYGFIECVAAVDDGGTALFIVAVSRETSVYLGRWAPGVDRLENPATEESDSSAPANLDWQGDMLTGAVEMFRGETPSGTAAWTITATPENPQAYEARSRAGNLVTRESGSEGDLAVDGTITFADGATVALDAGACLGFGGSNTVFENTPNAVLVVNEHVLGGCDIPMTAGGLLRMTFDEGEVVLAEFAAGADPETDPPLRFGSAFGELTPASLVATVPMFDVADEEPTLSGDAVLDAAWSAQSPTTQVHHYEWGRERIQRRALDITGTITMPDGRIVDLVGCSGVDELTELQIVDARIPMGDGA